MDERILTVSSLLAGYHDWTYLAQAFQIICCVWRGNKQTHEVRYGMTRVAATDADAHRLLAVIRNHWRIENGLPYRRNVTLHEDAMQIRIDYAPHVRACLNNLVRG